ncbi:MAG: hypothetical protein K6E52_00555 [Bacteroidaceae bacterium]|nr:hypothetical protein [Bacteroidaceae bacterium]
MSPSLPDIIAIYLIPCDSLPANITEKFRAHIPVSIPDVLTQIEHCGNASCEAVQQSDNGAVSEKTVLQFYTAENICLFPPLAFVITDAQNQSYVIGTKERPYPMVEITKGIDRDANRYSVKVTFNRMKSLIPCLINPLNPSINS